MPPEHASEPEQGDTQPRSVGDLLKQGELLAQQGQRESAYERSLRATNLAPHDPLAWYFRSQVSNSLEEQIFCLSRAYALEPQFPHGRQKMQLAIRRLLDRDPSLSYLNETAGHYQVRSGPDTLIQVPKNREHLVPYPQRDAGPTRVARRWFNWAVLGFVLGGVSAFILAPIAAWHAIRIQSAELDRLDRARLRMIILLSTLIWLASLPLVIIFALHFLG